jgi:hypothetical protein
VTRHGHRHGIVDLSITTTAEGLWALKWSFVVLMITALMQVAVVFGCNADIVFCGISLSRSLLGVKRTWVTALQMSAFDPKRTLAGPFPTQVSAATMPWPELRELQ